MRLCIVTGEASGDLHASGVLRELKMRVPSLVAYGIGGARLAEEGMELIADVRDMAMVGLSNVLRHLPKYVRVQRALIDRLRSERPDVLILVDFPDFNLRLARKARRLGFPVVYYIAPQLWAWRRRRIRAIRRLIDHVLVILPFEADFFRQHGVPVTYVGHPVVEQLRSIGRYEKRPHEEPLRIALLPGSRRSEVQDILPAMLDGLETLSARWLIEASLIQAPTIDRSQIDGVLEGRSFPVEIVERNGAEAVARSHLALASSGTATLEAAVLGTPMIVMYRLTALTYWLARWLVKLDHFSLVNIIAGREVVPELIQSQVRGDRIAEAAEAMLEPKTYERIRIELEDVRNRLGQEGASRNAAEAILRLVFGARDEAEPC